MINRIALPTVALMLAVSSISLQAQDTSSKKITLSEIDGRHWLVSADGRPFFAHGVTHVNNQRVKFDYAQFSTLCKKLGFTAYGYGCPEALRNDMPFIDSWNHLVPISYYRGPKGVKFVDIFDPDVQQKIDWGVKNNCKRALIHSENVIGFCWTDLASWPLENPVKKNWVEFIRGLPKDAPGQKAYQKFMATPEGQDPVNRDQAFLRLIAREYFQVVGNATRKYAPGHLVFGDRYAFNSWDDDVVQEMLPYVDGIAIQPHFWSPFPEKKFADIFEKTGKPIIICDFAIRFKDGDKDVRNWKMADNSTDAGKAYADYIRAALATKYIIGVFWCNPVDTPKGFGKPGVKQGFFGDGLTERTGLHESVQKLNQFVKQQTPPAVKPN